MYTTALATILEDDVHIDTVFVWVKQGISSQKKITKGIAIQWNQSDLCKQPQAI